MRSLLIIAVLLPCLLAQSTASSAWPFKPSSLDESSYGNVDVVTTQSFSLNVTVDFDNRSVYGTNTLTMIAVQDVSEIILDYQGINILNVSYQSVATQANWTIAFWESITDQYLGNAIRIYITDKVQAKQMIKLQVTYNTTTESQAINWLNPEQTASKTLNYMFTECQDSHCRSVAPMQDTPSIKSTYSAFVKVKKPYVVYMSANRTDDPTEQDGYYLYHFEMAIPIPSYLLAFSVGNLTNTSVGEGGRTFIISEPNVLEKNSGELSELDKLLNTTEDFMNPPNPYMWGHYSIIVQPPSFPIGGMENPLLTFASPTIIVGDKSQTYVATHEIAHSWTGNKVTCRDWSNFWLNEGFTTFIERKVSGELNGEDFAKIEAQLGNVSLWSDMTGYGFNSSYSSLFPEHNGHNPDDSSSQVTYEKGYQFLVYLESIMNNETDFRDLLREYVANYSLQSVTYIQFRSSFIAWVTRNYNSTFATEVLGKVDWDAWVLTPGPIPVTTLNFTTAIGQEFSDMADDYIKKGGDTSADKFKDYLNATNPNLKVIFLTQLVNRVNDINYKIMNKIDQDLNVTGEPNPELGQRWFPLAIQMNYRSAFDAAHKYVSSIGRQKYIVPVYTALVQYGYRYLAYQWFVENQNFYHPIAAKKIRSIILSTIDAPSDEAKIAFIEQEINQHKEFLN